MGSEESECLISMKTLDKRSESTVAARKGSSPGHNLQNVAFAEL